MHAAVGQTRTHIPRAPGTIRLAISSAPAAAGTHAQLTCAVEHCTQAAYAFSASMGGARRTSHRSSHRLECRTLSKQLHVSPSRAGPTAAPSRPPPARCEVGHHKTRPPTTHFL